MKTYFGKYLCPSCGNAVDDTPEGKLCPQCGSPKSEKPVRFLPDEAKLLTPEQIAQFARDPDIVCPFCGSDNAQYRFENGQKVLRQSCTQCEGALAGGKLREKKTYRDAPTTAQEAQQKQAWKVDGVLAPKPAPAAPALQAASKKRPTVLIGAGVSLMGVAVLIWILVSLFSTSEGKAQVKKVHWACTTTYERLELKDVTGWKKDMPAAAQNTRNCAMRPNTPTPLFTEVPAQITVYDQTTVEQPFLPCKVDNGNGTWSEAETLEEARELGCLETVETEVPRIVDTVEPVLVSTLVPTAEFCTYSLPEWVQVEVKETRGEGGPVACYDFSIGDPQKERQSSVETRYLDLQGEERAWQNYEVEDPSLWSAVQVGDWLVVNVNSFGGIRSLELSR